MWLACAAPVLMCAACVSRCKWRDGKLVPCDGAASTDPLPCPGKRGTTVTVESLFMNTQNRLGALTAKISETQANVESVVKAYAIANPTVSFSLKKVRELLHKQSSRSVSLVHIPHANRDMQTHHQSAQTSVVLQTRAVPSGDAQGIVAQLYGAALSDKLKLLSLDSDHPPYVPHCVRECVRVVVVIYVCPPVPTAPFSFRRPPAPGSRA